MADETKPRCTCAHCRVRGLMGPLMLITLGVIFMLGEYTHYGFEDLWPVLVIVPGVILLIQSLVSHAGHTDS